MKYDHNNIRVSTFLGQIELRKTKTTSKETFFFQFGEII